jgi:RHS repeat-associated protein
VARGRGASPSAGYEHYWIGSLANEMRDASGQMYMRNRYYDPQTGQFTQMDPIGLSGGLNVYGFAAGDPVSYSDPYGTCPRTARLAPLALSDGPVPAVDAGLALACAGELLYTGFRLVRAARAANSIDGQVYASENNRLNRRLRSEEGVIEEHFNRLEGRDNHHGDPNDPRNRADWKSDIARHIRQMEEYTDQIRGRRNQAPWREKIQEFRERLDNTP